MPRRKLIAKRELPPDPRFSSVLVQQFINYLLDPKTGAQLSNYINYATPNASAMPAIAEESRTNPRIYPPADQLQRLSYLQDVGDATSIYDEVWTAVKSR